MITLKHLKRASKHDVKTTGEDKYNDEQREEKRKFLAKRMVAALAAKLDLCVCGGLIYEIDGEFICGDGCKNPTPYRG